MGNTQLLLIVLGAIVIGVAVVIALDMFKDSAASANFDQVSNFLMELGSRAQRFYRTPTWLGGGGHSFTLISADAQGMAFLTNIPVNEHGTYSVLVAGTAGQVMLQGVGVEDGDGDGTDLTLTCLVTPNNIQMTTVNR